MAESRSAGLGHERVIGRSMEVKGGVLSSDSEELEYASDESSDERDVIEDDRDT